MLLLRLYLQAFKRLHKFMIKKIIAAFFLSVVILAPTSLVLAANPFAQGTANLGTATQGLGLESDVNNTIGTVIKGLLGAVGTIFFGLTIYAGILWMTAAGNEEQVTKATDIVKAAIIGLFITMSAYAITVFVGSKLGGVGAGAPEVAPAGSPAPVSTKNACETKSWSCVDVGSAQTSCKDPINESSPSGSLGCTTNQVCCNPL